MKIKQTTFLAIAIAFAITSCSKKAEPKPNYDGNGNDKPASLALTDFNPKTAKVGATIMITGTAFGTDSNAVSIKFGSASGIKPKTISATSMFVNVPANAQTGKLQITVGAKTVTSFDDFTLTKETVPAPIISSFTPQTAAIDETITIKGTGFGTDSNFVSIKFGASASVKPKTITATSMTVIVPADAQTGKIQIAINGGIVVSSATDFTLKPSFSISGFAPKTFSEGDTVVITGTNFGTNVNNVSIYLHDNASFKPFQVTPTKMSVVIPYDSSVGFNLKGKLRVAITGFDDVLSADDFNYLLLVQATSIDYPSARPGEIVNLNIKINRVNFGINVADLNALTINFGTSAPVKPLAATTGGRVSVRVPSDAKTGKIKASYTSYKTGTSSFIFTTLATLPQPVSAKWTMGADFRTDGKVGSIAFTIGKKAYVGLGSTNAPFDGIGSSDIWEFDQQYNAWTQKANFGGGARASAVAFAVSGKGYVGTGIDQNASLKSDFWEYDPTANTWAQKADFKGGIRIFATGFTIGNLGYVGAGGNKTTAFNDFYSYNPTTNTWTQTASIPGARSQAFVFVVGNNAYVGNGYDSNQTNLILDLNMYDPAKNTWTSKAPIPNFGAFGCTAFSIGDKGYVGLGYLTSTPTAKFYEYSTTTNGWKAIANFGGGVRTSAVGFAIGNIGYVGMGSTNSYTLATKDFWVYTP